MPSTPWGPYPWEPGGAWNQGGGTATPTPDPSQPIGGGTPAGPAQLTPNLTPTPETQATLAAQIAKHGPLVGQPSPVTYKDNITNRPMPDPSGAQTYTFQDGYQAVVGPRGELGEISPPKMPAGTSLKTPSEQAVNLGGVLWQPDPNNPNGSWIQVSPNEDAKAKAQADLQKTLTDNGYTQAQAAALALKTPAEAAQILAATGLSQTQQNQILQNMAIAQAKLPGELAQQQASTGYVQTQAANLAQATQIAAQKAGPEIAQMQAATGASQAQAQASQAATARTLQQIQQGNAPTIEQPGTGMYMVTRDPNTGAMTPQYNPNFTPKTQADVAGRVAQLQSMAQAQRDQISSALQRGDYGTGPDAQQKAAAAFDNWWSQTVEPQKAALQSAQQQALQDQQRLQQEQQRANLATAQTAAGAITSATAGEHRVGPGFGDLMANIQNSFATGKMPQPMSGQQLQSALVAPTPDYSQIYEQATAQALKHISPTAAQIATGQPVPTGLAQVQGMDIPGALNRTSYDAFGNPAPAQAAPPSTAPIAPVPAPAPAAQVPGQNYGAATAYTGGIPPWLAQPYAPGQYTPGVPFQ